MSTTKNTKRARRSAAPHCSVFPSLVALIGPSGRCRGVFDDSWGAWVCAFDFQTDEFRTRYWKRVEPSRRAMKRLGWEVIRGTFTPNTGGQRPAAGGEP